MTEGRSVISGAMRGLLQSGTPRGLTDGQLLERFATGRGDHASEWAFGALLQRHGPMVLRVCRGVLADPADAHDAFQATFLVLIRKARGLWVRDSLGPWLHQVALRTARGARTDRARRRRLDRALSERPPEADPVARDRDAERILHEELGRLPERYRAPLVLCDLEGRTHEQAARHLGWPIGTVKSRQSRGREHLRRNLVRRGIGPQSAALAAPPRGLFEAAMPQELVRITTVAMLDLAASRTLGGGSAALLARQTLGTLTMTRWWKLAATLIVLGATTSGAALLARTEPADDGRAPAQVQSPEPAKKPGDGPAEVPVVEARLGGFRPELYERGSLESSRIERGISTIDRPTTILMLLPDGAVVKKGDVVCELDTSALRDNLINQEITTKQDEANLENARSDREVAETSVREYAEGTLKVERAALKAAADGAQAAIGRAAKRLERTRAIRNRIALTTQKEGKSSPADLVALLDVEDRLEDMEAAVLRETEARDLAKSKLDVLETFTRPRVLRGLETEVKRKAAAQLAAEAVVSLEDSREAKLRRQIEACKVLSPVDGVARHAGGPTVAEGETVRERQVLFDVVDPSGPMLVEAKIQESRIDRVKPGQSAQVRVDAFPGRTFAGEVKAVAPLPDPVRPGGGGGPKAYSTRILIRDRTPDLTPGMTAEVRIAGEPSPRAIAVPKTALVLVSAGGGWIIVRQEGGRYDVREVETGLSDATRIEVRSGLAEGERVVADPYKDLGEKVKEIMRQTPTRLDR